MLDCVGGRGGQGLEEQGGARWQGWAPGFAGWSGYPGLESNGLSRNGRLGVLRLRDCGTAERARASGPSHAASAVGSGRGKGDALLPRQLNEPSAALVNPRCECYFPAQSGFVSMLSGDLSI